MTIGLQGTWSVSVKSKSAAWGQRFVIQGSDADGTYPDNAPPVLVTGEQWGVTIENNPTGPVGWRPSRARLAGFRVEGSFFNDLILTAAKPLNESEWIVYGTAKSYKGFCLFNPCFPYPWIVIDTPQALERLLQYDRVRPILERLYGADVAARGEREPFKPLVLPRGGRQASGWAIRGATELELKPKGKSKEMELSTKSTAEAIVAESATYSRDLGFEEVSILDGLTAIRPCEVNPIAQAILRFVEYDRTAAELGGGVYTGFGDRETLGIGATDEFGNYVFSFTRSLAELFDESVLDVPVGGDPLVAARPDLIIQFVEDPEDVAVYETAPYYDIPNIRRIDLCIPIKELVRKPCRGDRVLQYLGDIPIVNNPGSTLFADGTITNNTPVSESGPEITRGAWRGTLDIIGCFEDSQTPVTHYTIRYRAGTGAWNYLSVPAKGQRNQGDGSWLSESYGPTPTALSVGTVPAYRNIELETGWSLEVEHRKVRVNLQSLLSPDLPRAVDDVWFVIRGYDEDGDFVSGTYDFVKLRVDYEVGVGDIASIVVPGESDPGDCALLELPSDTTPLAIRFRATDADGFLAAWSLTAVKGSNNPVGLTDSATATVPAGAYPGAVVDDRYYGTLERSDADVDAYVVLNVTPPPSGWLEGVDFCAFSFELHMRDRTTNGKSVAGSHRVWDEVIGMSPTAS